MNESCMVMSQLRGMLLWKKAFQIFSDSLTALKHQCGSIMYVELGLYKMYLYFCWMDFSTNFIADLAHFIDSLTLL